MPVGRLLALVAGPSQLDNHNRPHLNNDVNNDVIVEGKENVPTDAAQSGGEPTRFDVKGKGKAPIGIPENEPSGGDFKGKGKEKEDVEGKGKEEDAKGKGKAKDDGGSLPKDEKKGKVVGDEDVDDGETVSENDDAGPAVVIPPPPPPQPEIPRRASRVREFITWDDRVHRLSANDCPFHHRCRNVAGPSCATAATPNGSNSAVCAAMLAESMEFRRVEFHN
ncbi:hypothetical protein HDV00_006331 [Rhizophlyctis rosea]|nr:hypothetical protein HDV00_006331 [Rhizophlyctis rosea]